MDEQLPRRTVSAQDYLRSPSPFSSPFSFPSSHIRHPTPWLIQRQSTIHHPVRVNVQSTPPIFETFDHSALAGPCAPLVPRPVPAGTQPGMCGLGPPLGSHGSSRCLADRCSLDSCPIQVSQVLEFPVPVGRKLRHVMTPLDTRPRRRIGTLLDGGTPSLIVTMPSTGSEANLDLGHPFESSRLSSPSSGVETSGFVARALTPSQASRW